MRKIVVIASTDGSVLSEALKIGNLKDYIYMVVSDRRCGAIELAKKHKIKTKVFNATTGRDFSDSLYDFFKHQQIDAYLSFYTKIFSGDFVKYSFKKLLNFHPSILPACPGRNGFGDTIKSGSKYIGSTLHLVDEGIDTGRPVIQSAFPYQPNLSFEQNRHIVFIQQCKILIQFIQWVSENRFIDGQIIGANYLFSEFIPNLESKEAIEFNV